VIPEPDREISAGLAPSKGKDLESLYKMNYPAAGYGVSEFRSQYPEVRSEKISCCAVFFVFYSDS
jgi:hypothetical protein